jgi:hypothetical protein
MFDTILGRTHIFQNWKFFKKIYQFCQSISIESFFQELDQERKVEVVRESFLETILNDITDIAILQEVIQRSQVEGGYWPPEKRHREN